MSENHFLSIGVAGAAGRMGAQVASAVLAADGLRLGALFDRPGSEGQVVTAGVLTTPEAAVQACQVLIDFTAGDASAALAQACAASGGPALVIGSTGFTPEAEERVAAAAQRIAIVKSGNFSLGVNLLMGLVAQASRALDSQAYDIEVFEAHHRRKVDAPSGTALMLGAAAAQGRGQALADVAVRVRDGMTGPRPAGASGFSVMRGGGIVGEHRVTFAAEDEIITLSHSARDRSLFARGAVEAARWVRGRPPGLYDMLDVLGLKA